MSYQHLTDAELIKYALIDTAPGSLAYLLATAYEDNHTHTASLEEEHASMIDTIEREKNEEIQLLHDQIETLERQLEAAEDEAVEKAIYHEMERDIDPLLE